MKVDTLVYRLNVRKITIGEAQNFVLFWKAREITREKMLCRNGT